MTALTMYDGINSLAARIRQLAPDAEMVAGYINGRYAWTVDEWELFPDITKVEITVTASANAGDVLDVENGDATPAQTAGWIGQRKQSGYERPTIYCARSVLPAVRRGTGRWVMGRDYDVWVADWTGRPHTVTSDGPGVTAECAVVQYQSTPDYDRSAVYAPGWPHRTVKTPPPTGLKQRLTQVEYRLSWDAVPGQTTYHLQVEWWKPGFGWDLVFNDWVSQAYVGRGNPGMYRWRVAAGRTDYIWSRWEEFFVTV